MNKSVEEKINDKLDETSIDDNKSEIIDQII